jgi:hypothetical protein
VKLVSCQCGTVQPAAVVFGVPFDSLVRVRKPRCCVLYAHFVGASFLFRRFPNPERSPKQQTTTTTTVATDTPSSVPSYYPASAKCSSNQPYSWSDYYFRRMSVGFSFRCPPHSSASHHGAPSIIIVATTVKRRSHSIIASH